MSEIGTCDYCGKQHANGSNLDHCAECGQCFDHCECAQANMIGPKTNAQDLYPYYSKARKAIAKRDTEWLDEAREYEKNGYRPHYCPHGTDLWVDWDPICGMCEEGLTPLQEAVYYAMRWRRDDNEKRGFDMYLAWIEQRAA